MIKLPYHSWIDSTNQRMMFVSRTLANNRKAAEVLNEVRRATAAYNEVKSARNKLVHPVKEGAWVKRDSLAGSYLKR